MDPLEVSAKGAAASRQAASKGSSISKTHFHTFGCKVNTYDTGLMEKDWVDPSLASGNLHIFNTCAVTAEASKEALRSIQRVKQREPDAKIIVTGCSAQVDTRLFDACPSVDLVLGNSHKEELSHWTEKFLKGELKERVIKSNIFKKTHLGAGGGKESQHTRSFLKIQDGCNSFCSFCVIPFARGKSRNLPDDQIVSEVKSMAASGTQEVVLTGIHIGDYRTQSGECLEKLVARLLAETSMSRIRLTSLEPPEITPGLLELFKSERLCPHLHMSIQSGCSSVLKAMKRQYSGHAVTETLPWIRQEIPHAFIGMDVIVGFPGEDDFDFEVTLNRLKSLPWTRIHVFPYSERPGTYAHRIFPKVAPEVIAQRAQRLRLLSSERHSAEAQKQIGTIASVLMLKPHPKKNELRGLARGYWPVVVSYPKDDSGRADFENRLRTGYEVQLKITAMAEAAQRPLQLIGSEVF